MSATKMMGDLPGTKGESRGSKSIARVKRYVLGALWYAANAGGVLALYMTRLAGG